MTDTDFKRIEDDNGSMNDFEDNGSVHRIDGDEGSLFSKAINNATD